MTEFPTMNEEQKRIEEAWGAFYKAEEELKKVKARPGNPIIRKQRLKEYYQALLFAKVQETLPEIPPTRIREFITDLQDILKNFDEKKVHAFINNVAMEMRLQNDSTDKKTMGLARKNLKRLNKKISKMNDELQGIINLPNLGYLKFYTYYLPFSGGMVEAERAYNSLTELQKYAIQVLSHIQAGSRGRVSAKKDVLVHEIAIWFNEFFKRPTTNPTGPFYEIVQRVRQELGQDSVDPYKSVRAAVATLRKRRFITIKEEVEKEEKKQTSKRSIPPEIVIL